MESRITSVDDRLESLGYRVIAARDADAALLALDNQPCVDLLMTDIELPGVTGPELVQVVIARRSGIPVLYTTGYTQNALIDQQLLDRTARVLTKPFSLQSLAPVVRELLDARSPP